MIVSVIVRPVAKSIALLAALTIALPAHAEHAPQGRLVHCGQDTCLRLSGRRQRPEVVIEVGGQDLAVTGRRDWVVTIPLWRARQWVQSFGDPLTLTDFDPQSNAVRTTKVLLPPGALGRHVELASLVVRAR